MNKEASTEEAVNHFHGYFRLNDHRRAVSPDRIAVWRLKRAGILLSALVATVLANEGLINAGDLELYEVAFELERTFAIADSLQVPEARIHYRTPARGSTFWRYNGATRLRGRCRQKCRASTS